MQVGGLTTEHYNRIPLAHPGRAKWKAFVKFTIKAAPAVSPGKPQTRRNSSVFSENLFEMQRKRSLGIHRDVCAGSLQWYY